MRDALKLAVENCLMPPGSSVDAVTNDAARMSVGSGRTERAVDISVVICTLDRHERLLEALRSLFAQDVPPGLVHEILVVDNSAAGNARELVARLAEARPGLVRYRSEPRTNLSHARNTALAEARGRLVAFMDDDMKAPPGWLAAAVAAMERTQADVLLGKIVPEFEEVLGWASGLADSDRWFGRVYPATEDGVLRTRRDGHIPGAGIGNTVLRRAALPSDQAAPFDPAFGRSGGEDTDLLQRLGQRGAVIAFSEQAWMTEFVPRDRSGPDYLRRRRYLNSQQFVRSAVKNSRWKGLTGARHMLVGGAQLAFSGMRWALARSTGQDDSMARIAAASALGKLFWMRQLPDGQYR
jgi:glycosyltransferase involved in cell wall biosynthesis